VEAGLESQGGRAPIALVVSAGAGDGKTSVAANLAAAFVESGLSTVAVNTDFRRPSLSERILGRVPDSMGFFVEDIPDIPVTMVVNRTSIEGLSVFDVAGAIGSPGDKARVTARMLPQLAAEFGAVVVDSSPVGATAEVLEIVPRADVIIVVVRVDHTFIESANRTIEIIRTLTNAPLLLTVVGEAPDRDDYYDYGARPQPAKKRKPAKSKA
jgi:MinD-like ATPase involved in chromosome partitioning or flagellar assembly